VPFWITWQSGEAFTLENWAMTKRRFSGGVIGYPTVRRRSRSGLQRGLNPSCIFMRKTGRCSCGVASASAFQSLRTLKCFPRVQCYSVTSTVFTSTVDALTRCRGLGNRHRCEPEMRQMLRKCILRTRTLSSVIPLWFRAVITVSSAAPVRVGSAAGRRIPATAIPFSIEKKIR